MFPGDKILFQRNDAIVTNILSFNYPLINLNRFKKTLWYSVFIGLLGISSGLQAETGRIIGRVNDASNAKPLGNTNVVVIGTIFGAATDEQGRYSIEGISPGTYSLSFTHIGYQTITKPEVVVTSARPETVDEELIPVVIAGAGVTVKVGLFNQQMTALPGTTTLSGEEIRRFPGGFEDVVRTVSTLPGVAVVNDGGRNDLLVRGGGPSENLYIVNSVEVPNINHFGVQGSGSGSLSFVNLDFIDHVHFSAGGFGVEYGDKLSSVLDIDLRPGRTDRYGGRLTMSATQFGADVEGPVFGSGSAIFSARKSYLDLIFKAAGLPFIPVYTDYNLAATWDLPRGDRLTLIGMAALDKVERDQSSVKNRVLNAGIMDNTQDQYVVGGSFRRLVSKGYLDIALGMNRSVFKFSQADTQEIKYFGSNASENEYSFKISRLHAGFLGGSMKAGFSAKLASVDNQTAFADTIYDRNGNRVPLTALRLPNRLSARGNFSKTAFWTEYKRNLTERLESTIGLRWDYYDFIARKLYTTARFGLDFKVSEVDRIKATLGRYYQPPSYVWVINPDNRNLKALRSDMLLLGVEHLFREDLLFEVEGFHKWMADLPAGGTNAGVGYGGREDDFGSFGYQQLVPTGKGIAYGIELQLQKRYTPAGFYGQAGLSIGRSRYTAPNGKSYPGQYDQAVVLSISGGYKPNPRWEYNGKFRFWTGSPYTPVYRPSQNNGKIVNLPDEYLAKRLKPGHHLDLRVDRRFNFTTWAMVTYVDVQNVYNYAIPVRPSYDFWNDKVSDKNEIAILPSIGVRAEF
jgi:hypothetical protein